MAVGLSTVVHGIGVARGHRAQPGDHRGRDPRRGVDHRHQHARQADRARRGRADRVHRRDLRHPARRSPRASCSSTSRVRRPTRLGALARHYETYIVVQCKARWPEVIDGPLLQRPVRDLAGRARSCTRRRRTTSGAASARASRTTSTTDGSSCSATGSTRSTPCCGTDDIGNIGTICCSDGEYPEAVRALAFNGAEVVYRPSEAVPMTQTGPIPAARGCCRTAPTRISTTSTWCARTSARSMCTRRWSIRSTSPAATRTSWITPGNVLGHTVSGANTFVAADHRHRGAAPVPDDEPQLQLDEGPAYGDVPAHVRGADSPGESVAARTSRGSTPRSTRYTGRTSSG